MIIFYLVLALGLSGIGYVLWNLKNETEHQSLAVEKIDPDQMSSFALKETLNVAKKFELPSEPSKSKLNFSFPNVLKPLKHIFGNIKPPVQKNNQSFDLKTEKTFLLKDKFSQNPFNTPNFKPSSINSVNNSTEILSKSASQPMTSLSPIPSKQLNSDEIKKIEAEIDLAAELKKLKTKHERLEKIFQERNGEFEKNQEALNNELKNRKEFNKIKDLLEKELKEVKNQTRDSQAKLNLTNTESEGYKKRNDLLEERITKLEKDILRKEEEIDTLVKRLQTFASPATSATPPKRDLPSEKTPEAEVIISKPPASEISKPIEILPEAIISPAIETIVNIPSNDSPGAKDTADQISSSDPAAPEEIPFLKLKPDVTDNHESPKEQT